ncbi:MAG: V-type ATP synthase subunit C [Clostridia bacterium]|nr:V-type ATP synthase subunit C [Clostridia bacterium]
MPSASDTTYAYAVSRIRAIERKLLDKGKLDRMVDARTAEEAMKVLAEADYGDAHSEPAETQEYEKLLINEHKKVYRLLKDIAPEPAAFDVFLVANDYHNIKVILKAEFSAQELNESILTETGSISIPSLRTIIRDRKMSDLPAIMRNAVFECIDVFGRTADPQMVDIILDKACFAQMKQMAESTGVGFLRDLIAVMIDLANIRTLIRVKRMKKPWDFLQKVLIPGGRIDMKLFVENADTPFENLSEMLKYTAYSQIAEEGLESFRNTGSLTKLEKLSDNFIMSFVKRAKFISFGIEPLVGYLMAKEYELKNVRIIMVGKINNISNDIIRERLRDAYV